MTTRPLSLLATLALLACGEPFAPEPPSKGPGLGAIRVLVDVPGNGTFDQNGFLIRSPFFDLPFPWYGGEAVSPDLPEGLRVTLAPSDLVEWCHPSPASRQLVIRRDDTLDVAFTVTCDLVRRSVRFRAFGTPVMTTPVSIGVSMPFAVFTLRTGESRLESLPVNLYNVTLTFPANCTRAATDQQSLNVPLYPPDTIKYDINLQCIDP